MDPRARAVSQWKDAAQEYKSIVTQEEKKTEKNDVARNNLAWIMVKYLDQGDEAYRLVEEARKNAFTGKPLSADRFPIQFVDTIGFVYYNVKKPAAKEAQTILKQAVTRYPEDPRLHFYLASTYQALGNKIEARLTYQKVLPLLKNRTAQDRISEERLTELERLTKEELAKLKS